MSENLKLRWRQDQPVPWAQRVIINSCPIQRSWECLHRKWTVQIHEAVRFGILMSGKKELRRVLYIWYVIDDRFVVGNGRGRTFEEAESAVKALLLEVIDESHRYLEPIALPE